VFSSLTKFTATIAVASLVLIGGSLVNPKLSYGDAVVTVDPNAAWQGFMNVFEIDRNTTPPTQGDFVFASGWGFNDLTASFDGSGALTLGVNSIGDADKFWYVGGGGPGALGNKWMDANGFVQVDGGGLSGMDVTFTGNVLSNTFTENHTATAFIRDFAPDFSSFNEVSVLLTPGVFDITLATIDDPNRHVQYGFNVQGENVWITDIAPFGNAVVTAVVPEPVSSTVLMISGLCGLAIRRRR